VTDKTSDILHDILWVERYRPTSLDELALDEENRALLAGYLAAAEVPHLLLVGPPGVGKTTIARIIYRALDCRVLVLNASSERGIDTVREKIGNFVTAASGARWNIVFLDEADALTADAQTALRNLMEAYADRSRFILTANKVHRIIGPIQSRCQVLSLSAPPLLERFRVLLHILKAEGVTADKKVVLGYAERYSDLRQMLMTTMRAVMVHQGTLPAIQASDQLGDGAAVLARVEAKDWTAIRRFAQTVGFDPQETLRNLFWAVPDTHPKAGFLRHTIGRGVHETGFTPDPVILFLAVCAEVMEGL